MNRLAIYLNRHIDGVVYSAPSILSAKSTDRSILRYYPRLVAEPINTLDVRKLVRFSYQLAQKNIQLPITLRGSGKSKIADDIGSGLVISTKKLNNIQEIDPRQRLVRAQTGVTLGEMQNALSLHGFFLPVIGDSDETLGDLLARNALAYNNTAPGNFSDFVETAEVILSDGSIIETEELKSRAKKKKVQQKDFEGDIYHELSELIAEEKSTIAAIDEKDKSGYPGIKRQKSINLNQLLAGSSNNLAIVTEFILRVEPVFDAPNRIAIVCRNANDYVVATKLLTKYKLNDIIAYDTELFNEIKNTGKTSQFFRKASDDGYIIIASAKDDSKSRRRSKIKKLKAELSKALRFIEEDAKNSKDFDVLSQNLCAYLNDSSKNEQHIPLIDGVYVPEEQQKDFLNQVTKMADVQKIKLAVFARPEFNIFTVRPNINIATSAGRAVMIKFMRGYLDLVQKCGGNPCGESSEGRFLPIFYNQKRSAASMSLDQKIKGIFDPFDILNPGVKHEADARTILKHFRASYEEDIISEY